MCFVIAAVFGGPAPGVLKGGRDFEDPGSESASARDRLEGASGRGTAAGMIVLVKLGAPVTSSRAQATLARVRGLVAHVPAVAAVADPDGRGGGARVSRDGRRAYLAVTFKDLDAARLEDAAERIQDELSDIDGVQVGGRVPVGLAVGEQVGKDLARAEALAFPIILLLSFVFFRGFVAADAVLRGRADDLRIISRAATRQ
jgi:RND superfamily putative drug exporter